MGEAEKRGAKTAKRARIQTAVLLSLYAAGAVTLMVLAPNAMRLLTYADPYIDRKTDPARRMSQAMSRLRSRGLVRYHANGKLELTDKGEREAKRMYAMQDLHASKPPRWDGRWRIVMFDVWERRKNIRGRLRSLLQQKGFIRLQHSVWIYPYDCEDLVAFIRTDLRLGRGLLYFVADGAEYDRELKAKFGLK